MKRIRKFTALLIATIMMASNIAPAFASIPSHDSPPSQIINSDLQVKVAKLGEGQKAKDLIQNPKQPDIYTLRTDYKVQRGEKYEINYQPYIASVGEAASPEEKAKVNKTIILPDLAGYDKSQLEDDYKINYDIVKDAAKDEQASGDDQIGLRYEASKDFRYKAKTNYITIKHIFQKLDNFSEYTNKDGTTDDENAHYTSQQGNTGSTMEVSPLQGKDVEGFEPERASITMQVPENAENFILEYRYNRKHYDVTFDSAGGTALPSRTLYYEQLMPKIDENSVPTKVGGDFQGWKPSIDLKSEDGRKFKAGEIIEAGNNIPIKNLDANLIMPASKVTFTAVWKDKEKADYAVQFWAEKADHADDASLMDKYDYMGTRVYKDKDTGSRPNLDAEPVNGLKFPDLDQARLNKIWANARFNRGKDLYLNKFFVYNKELTDKQNQDSKKPLVTKEVSATGKTVYNIYYDRQVYDLYFTKSNAQPKENTIYPEIWKYDEKKGETVKVGGPGNPYHYKARFNEMMYKWPNDAKQTKGFTPGYQSFGWGPNYTRPNWPLHLDTPPYRLNADEFLDMADYDTWGGYTKHIDKGDGTTKDLDRLDFTTLSFGIKQDKPSIPHHMDFWMDGFKDGETIIRYDLVRTKADTNAPDYGHRYPKVTGFTPYGYNPRAAWPAIHEGSEENGRVNEAEINDLNDERDEITPNNCGTYYNNNGVKLPIGQLDFIPVFFSDSDEYGDVKEGGQEFTENGYLQFHYKRNKYPLRFNYDPSIIRDDSYFDSKNQLDTFYEFPLKALSPEVDKNDEYKKVDTKEGPKNLLDNPENLQELGLTDLVFTDPKDGKLKVKRPDNLSDQMVFKGWALDPAGTKLVWENPKETMPFHPLNLYAKWGEPDYKWKVTFDPAGGKLKTIKEEKLTTERKTIQEGDIGQEETNTYPKKEANNGNKQVFTVIQRQKLVKPDFKPEKKGYDFMGWEVIHYKKDENGKYTDQVDTSYRDTYKVPELYSFGNDVVGPVYLKAIWVPNQRVDVKVEHYMLDKDYKFVKKHEDTLEDKRAGYLVATTGDRQNDEYLLAPHSELEEKLPEDLKKVYDDYNERVNNLNNSFFQTFRVEPEKKLNTETNQIEDNPDFKNNVFKFFYRPYRKREYKVNYIDERFKGQANEKDGAIVSQEDVENGNRHYDAINYRPIPGWVLTSKPQQQLFFDLNEETNEFLGINGTGKKEITFYYKDVRVIEIPSPKEGEKIPDPPKGYVRVTYKADKGGAFTDKDGNSKTELYYDVIKGLKSDLLPVPEELGTKADGTPNDKVEGKYYITPETGKKFTKWDNRKLLNDNTEINTDYEFTAYFEWSGLSTTGLVRTEAFKDPENNWTNDFAPTIDQLKAQLVWREKDQVKDLPAGTEIKLYDEAGTELTSDDQVYNLVNEKKAADKDQLVRIVNVKAKVTFKDGKEPQELDIPITVYKNVYEALNKKGDKPLFLTEAEGKDAKDGGLKDVTGNYVKVTVQPTEKNTNKDVKVYYVNPKAWVNIPEVEWSEADKDKYDFLKWTADKKEQNENKEENGIFDFSKRHKFTDKETLIKPLFTNDVVEQKEGEDKPKVPNNFVKVIVKTTDKATTESTQTFWVNPTKEVAISVAEPTGKTDQEVDIPNLGKKKVNYIFKEWQKVKAGEADNKLKDLTPAKINLASHKYTDKVTVIEAAYKKSIQPGKIEEPLKTKKLDTPQGKEITNDDLIKQITPQEGKEIESIEVISKPDPSNPGKTEAKVIVKYKDGTTQGTDDNPVVIPVEVHKNIIPEAPGGERPKDAMENYVKVIFTAGDGGNLSGNLVYYVSPEVEVDMTESAGKITKKPSVGYFVNGENWTNKDNKALKGTFTDPETEFIFNFDKYENIIEKTGDPNQVIPKDYVKVTFKAEKEGSKGKLINKEGNQVVQKIFYVNPKAGIKLVELADGQTAGEKQLAVPKTQPAEHYEDDKWYEDIDTENPITSERIHVAKFKLVKVTLTYNKGGDDVNGDVPAVVTVNYGTTVSLASPDKLRKDNSSFAGWKLDGDDKIYYPGDQVTLEKARTAIAQWNINGHTVTFDTKGGSDVPIQTVAHGDTATNPDAPTSAGKVFMGWKENENDKNYFDFSTPITADKTLIAIWQDAVQEINDGDTVEDQFIKVTFLKGKHGTLYFDPNENLEKVTYKVAKDYTFEEALQNGMGVPGIKANKYYKAKEENSGWDKALDLTLEADEIEKVFTAQYEPIADVIPIDPETTDEDIKKEKPEGMVLVQFIIDEENYFMETQSKFYVAMNKEVTITPPLVYNNPGADRFKGWKDITLNNDEKLETSFEKDTDIYAEGLEITEMKIYNLDAGIDFIPVEKESLEDGARGYIEIIRGDQAYKIEAQEYIKERKIGRRRLKEVRFGVQLPAELGRLQSGDILRHWAEKGSIKSKVIDITIK